ARQHEVNGAAAGEAGVEHGGHEEGGGHGEAEVDVEGPAQLLVGAEVLKDVRLEDADHDLEAEQGGEGKGEEGEVGPDVQAVVAAGQGHQGGQQQRGDGGHRHLQGQNDAGAG